MSSPSTEETVNGRFWCIEQQAELFPAAISGRGADTVRGGGFWCIEQQAELFPAAISGREQLPELERPANILKKIKTI